MDNDSSQRRPSLKFFSLLRSLGFSLSFALSLFLVGQSVLAQTNPTRPIRIVVPLPAGTATDMAARMLGQQLSILFNQPFVVDNKPGANGTIGVMDLLRSPPDGHTLLIGSNSPLATNFALLKVMPYDPRRDFTPIVGFGETMHVLMVRPNFPAKNLAEFVAYVKQRPGKISAGVTTSSTEVQIATLNQLSGMDLLPVPYKGIPATITDVMGGTLDVTLVDLANAMAQAKGGNLRPLAVTSMKRNALVPDWPSIAETFPGYDFPSWVGLVGPAGMAKAMVDRINVATAQVLKQPAMAEKLATMGMTPMPMQPDQFKTFIDAELVKWVRLAKDANVQPQ